MKLLKRIGMALLLPHLAVRLILTPTAAVFLVYSLLYEKSSSLLAIASYVLAAYTLTVWCFKIPTIIRFFKGFKSGNRYAAVWFSDARLRVNISLYGSLAFNTAYAVMQLRLGFYHGSFWFCSLASYYILLAIMRFYLVRYTRLHAPGAKMSVELKKYRLCGIIFLIMNLTLSVIVFFMVYWDRTFRHHEITTIAMAAYTFTAFTLAVVNIVRYRKYNSPVYSASKAISLTAACVSMLTLESTMLTTFGDGTMDMSSRRIMLGVSGGVVSAFIIAMAIYMIVQSTRKIKEQADG